MPRTQGSKNKRPELTEKEIEIMQQKIDELTKVHNNYDQVIESFVEGFVMDLYNKDIIKRIDNKTLQSWFNNPDENMDKITSLLTYYYIIDGNIFQLYDLISSLPELDYKITVLNKDEQSHDDLNIIKYFLEKKIKHKELTRDLLSQLASKGTLIGTWLGNKKDPYFYVFDNLKYIYPYGRYKGEMVGVIDLEWLGDMSEIERSIVINNLSPLITEGRYKSYKEESNSDKREKLRYITLPQDKTLVGRIHTLSRNQRLGIPFGTQALFDIQHKQKLKDLEIAISNKIIRAMAVLKMRGKDDNDIKVSASDKRKVFNSVKKVLERNSKDDGITVVGIPDWATFDFPEIKNGEKSLNPEKYESINADLASATGISPVLTNGTGGSYSSAYLNLSILYKRIGILLEKIEVVYNQLINMVLGKRGDNYIFQYNTQEPLKPKDKIDVLIKLHSMEGFSLKHVIDNLNGVEWDDYINQSIYEQEELKLQQRIKPYSSAYTSTGNSDGGAGRHSGDNKEENDDGNMQPSHN